MTEKDIKQQQIKGVRLTTVDLQLLAGGLTPGNMLKLFWRLKGQWGALLSMLPMVWPFIQLGPAELRDMGEKFSTRFKPLLDLFPRPK
jgi:hypothetical protein